MFNPTPRLDPTRESASKVADQLLAEAGYDWSGRRRLTSEEAQRQATFERRMVCTPTGGVNGKHR